MWINYLKVIFRTLNRNKFFSLINIIGLSVGIAAFVLIMMFVEHEFEFDKHFKNANQIYRVTLDMEWEQAPTQFTALAPGPTAIQLAKDYPEIIAGTRFSTSDRRMFEAVDDHLNTLGQKFYENNIFKVDSNFFKVFDIQILAGDKNTMLTIPNSVVLSKSLAEKYFGTIDVMGKSLKMDNEQHLTITGVMMNLPTTTHFKTDILLTTNGDPNFEINNWRTFLYSFVKVSENTDLKDIDQKLLAFKEKHYAPWKETSTFRFQKMLDIHLKNDRIFDYALTGDIKNVLFLISIAFLVLVIACMNFINLSTARSVHRSKEVGIRKVVGASRKRLIVQFLGESIMVSFISMFIAIVLIESIIPEFQKLIGANLSVNYSKHLISFIGLAIVIGLFSGIYPAFFTSSFQPMVALKNRTVLGGASIITRKILVIFQFVVMVILLSGVMVIFQQMKYVKNRPLGFDKNQIVYTSFKEGIQGDQANLLKEMLLSNPNIKTAFLTSQLPGETPFGDHFLIEGNEKSFPARTTSIGYGYIPGLGIEILKGRNFSNEFGTDSSSCIINETAMNKFGWNIDNVIGKKISWNFASSWDDQINGRVIGVVKDYHFKSLHEEIEPIILTFNPSLNRIVAAKINTANIDQTIKFIEKSFIEINPAYPFEYSFLSDDFKMLYKREAQFEKIFRYFVVLAIIIAILGLLGLTAFMAEKKVREIGIRKTYGASILDIIKLFTREFTLYVIIANIIGIPIAVLILNRWLNNFSYRINITWWLFLMVFALSLIIAIGTVAFLAWKAALKNPIEAIKYE